MRAYATAHKTRADPHCVSCCNGASSNRVPNGKKKSGGSKRNLSDKNTKRELLLAEDGQHYARVTKRLGDGRFEALCLGDGQTRLAVVRGKLWKRVWINPNDLVLVALRAFQDQKVDIVHKFTNDEERMLGQMRELPVGACRPDEAYESELQATRDVHGVARAGFIPTDDDFAFGEED